MTRSDRASIAHIDARMIIIPIIASDRQKFKILLSIAKVASKSK
ncbi:hypothetical protein [Chamaesiphon polymorphus]|nr:hypothetical protein [Chamaesiphon polymorphus]